MIKKNRQNELSIAELLSMGAKDLRTLPSKRLEAEVLLSYVIKKNKVEMYRSMLNKIDPTVEITYKNLLQRRISGVPLCYITGKREFFGLDLFVNEATLIPRHETETLVEQALFWLKNNPKQTGIVLEIGIGSGAISIALANHCHTICIDAVDISEKALCVAAVNINKYQFNDRIHLFKGNLFSPIPPENRYNLIISNPPYIPTKIIPTLAKEVRAEPFIALNGGAEGLTILHKIIREAKNFLLPNGCLLLEIGGILQEKKVIEFFYQYGYRNVFTRKDLAGITRVVGGSQSNTN